MAVPARPRRPLWATAPPLALSALLLGTLAGCEEEAVHNRAEIDSGLPDADYDTTDDYAPDADADAELDLDADAPDVDAPDIDATEIDVEGDGAAPAVGMAEPAADGPPEFAAILEALPAGAAGQLGPMLDGWADRETDPMAATQAAFALMQAGTMLQGTDEELGYDAFRLSGEAGEAAVAGELPADVPREVYGGIFYNQACALALDGETDAALAALDRAADYGWTNWDLAKTDSDLDALRDLPAFEDRLEGWEAAAKEAAVAEARKALAEGESFPLEFAFTDTEGQEHSLADYRGEVVIADFWATWCGPCVREIPTFIALQEQYGDDGLQILGLNYERGADEEAKLKKIVDFAEEYAMNYPTGPGSEEANEMVSLRAFPTTVFVGRDGTVRLKLVGTQSEAFLETIVTELLAEPAPPAEETPAATEPAETDEAAEMKADAAEAAEPTDADEPADDSPAAALKASSEDGDAGDEGDDEETAGDEG